MNGKKARAIRKMLELTGNYYDQAEYDVPPMQNFIKPNTITLKPGCGRKVYKDVKKAVKSSHDIIVKRDSPIGMESALAEQALSKAA